MANTSEQKLDKIDIAITPLKPFGITVDDYRRAERQFKVTTGRDANEYDVMSNLFHLASRRAENSLTLAKIFEEGARYLYRHNHNPHFVLRKSSQRQLAHLQNAGYATVKLVGPTDRCRLCREECGIEINIETALQRLSAPFPDCQNRPILPGESKVNELGLPIKAAPRPHAFCEARYEQGMTVCEMAESQAAAARGEAEQSGVTGPTVIPPSPDAWEEVSDGLGDNYINRHATSMRTNATGQSMYLVNGRWVDEVGDVIPVLFILSGRKRGVWLLEDEAIGERRPKYQIVPGERIQHLIRAALKNDPSLAERRKTDPEAAAEIWKAVEVALLVGIDLDSDTVDDD